ncbi:PHP domain-containing protein [Nocardioides ginkgobilobae]
MPAMPPSVRTKFGLPADSHVHSEWSWDAPDGSMERTCERAAALGLPSVTFTEHADMTGWTLPPEMPVPEEWQDRVDEGVFLPPPFDLEGYAQRLDECRDRYPGLRIYSGIELSEPHWHVDEASWLLEAGAFDHVLAGVHSARLDTGPGFVEFSARYADDDPGQAVRDYLIESALMIEHFDDFETLAHIDYPVRQWPADGDAYRPTDFEDEYRHVLRLLAGAGKALEFNTKVPLHLEVLKWWHEEGGDSITFASDAHDSASVARGFADAVRRAEAAGFRPGPDPLGCWRRS